MLVGDVQSTVAADAALDEEELDAGGDAAGTAARLVQRMAASADDAAKQRRCAQACATLADTGGAAALLAAKALAQLAIAMRAHSGQPELQACGCAVLARMPLAPDGTHHAHRTADHLLRRSPQHVGRAAAAVLSTPP